MALLPLVAGTPRITGATSGLASSRRGDGTLVRLFQGNTQSGSRIERITAYNMAPEGTSNNPAYSVRLYITDTNGNNPRLFREQIMALYTVQETTSTPLPSESVQWIFPSGLVIGTNSSISVGQSTAGTNFITHWVCEGSDF